MRTVFFGLAILAVLGSACRSASRPEGSRPEGASADRVNVAPSGQGGAAQAALGNNPGGAGKGTALTPQAGHELAAFAAGCFWGVEDAFRHVPGITATAVGYSNGHTKDPDYDAVCTHTTGHAETLLVEFDPKVVSYARLVNIFFQIHDPTTKNRQGPDVGDQYRSAIFTLNDAQVAAARTELAVAQKDQSRPVVTEVTPLGPFYRAEDYHQQYTERTGHHGCPIHSFK
jgi:peptide-methionine (S)-S-oxide reductase